MKLTAIILTLNEEENIEDCIRSVSFADEILVVDSGSTDRTIRRALLHKCAAIRHDFEDFASQRNFAMQEAKGDWLLFVDADERISPELARKIPEYIKAGNQFSLCFAFSRINTFFGKPLKWLSRGDYQTRLMQRDSGEWEGKVHEKFISKYPTSITEEPIIHLGTKNFKEWERKFYLYIPLEKKKRWIPLAKFLYLYFVRLGILDGWVGFQYCVLAEYYEYSRRT